MSSRRHLKSAGSLPGIVWQDTFRRAGVFDQSYPEVGQGQWVWSLDDNILETIVWGAAWNMEGNPIGVDGILRYNQIMPGPGTYTAVYDIQTGFDFTKPWEAEFDSLAWVSPNSGIHGSISTFWVYYGDFDNHFRLQSHPSDLGWGYRRLITISRVGGIEDRQDYNFVVPDERATLILIPIRAVYNGSTIATYVNGTLAATITNPVVTGQNLSRVTVGGILAVSDGTPLTGIARVALKQ